MIGSANSSNTRALEKLARQTGCPLVARIDTADEIPEAFLAPSLVVGVTAGASAPGEVVDAVIQRLAPVFGVETAASSTRTSTSRRRATSARCRAPSRRRPRRCSAGPSAAPASTTATSAPATCSPASPSADRARPSVGDDAPPLPPPAARCGTTVAGAVGSAEIAAAQPASAGQFVGAGASASSTRITPSTDAGSKSATTNTW